MEANLTHAVSLSQPATQIRVHCMLGTMDLKAKWYDDADEHCKMAKKYLPNVNSLIEHIEFWHLHGLVKLLKYRQYEQAIASLGKALKLATGSKARTIVGVLEEATKGTRAYKWETVDILNDLAHAYHSFRSSDNAKDAAWGAANISRDIGYLWGWDKAESSCLKLGIDPPKRPYEVSSVGLAQGSAVAKEKPREPPVQVFAEINGRERKGIHPRQSHDFPTRSLHSGDLQSTAKDDPKRLVQPPGEESQMDLQELKGKVDFAIITMREDEFRAVLDRFPGEPVQSQKRFYRISRAPTEDGAMAVVAIARASEQGTGEAQTVARHIIDDLDPHWILVVGIAGGVPDFEYTLGDVVLSTRVNDLTVHARHEASADQFAISGGPSHYEVTKLVTVLPMLESKLRDWNTRESIGRDRPPVDWNTPESVYGDEKWQARVVASLKHHFGPSAAPREPVARAGPIGSSDGLLKDTKALQQWLDLTRNTLAVEMEAAGVYRAVRSSGREYPFLAIRGLSDIVGFKRHPDWTAYACHSAAAFTLALIKSGLVTRRK